MIDDIERELIEREKSVRKLQKKYRKELLEIKLNTIKKNKNAIR
tara:strand:- start:375 stop:506 length:132 start_codon:yes stop_codon:yes gene_type:complete